jgi:hypothetical protein
MNLSGEIWISTNLSAAEKEKLRLAPFIGVGRPGIIAEDGTIKRGADNLPRVVIDHAQRIPPWLEAVEKRSISRTSPTNPSSSLCSKL